MLVLGGGGAVGLLLHPLVDHQALWEADGVFDLAGVDAVEAFQVEREDRATADEEHTFLCIS